MCTHPIQLTRRNRSTNSTYTDLVPCGKCEECISFKQKEFAALSVHEAIKSGSVYFFTLTYNDAHLPVAIHDGERLIGFDGRLNREIPLSWFTDGDGRFMNMLVEHDGLMWTPSLHRHDVICWFKQFRTRYNREHDEPFSGSYCFFGELGEHRGRPHYHGLVYGISPEDAKVLKELWEFRFGFACCLPQDYRKFSLDEIGAVTSYVSKYVSKGVDSRFIHLLPYIEAPRRICSQGFGNFSEEEIASLRKYYDGVDLRYLDKEQFLEQVLLRRKSLIINGVKYPIPLKLKEILFKDGNGKKSIGKRSHSVDEYDSCFKKSSLPCKSVNTKLSALVKSFARCKFDRLLNEQLRQSSEGNSDEVHRRFIRSFQENEISTAQAREEIAQQNNLNSLKSQSDGQ